MRILILGDGFLGKKYNKYFEDSFLSAIKINSVEDVVNEINIYSPSVLINCIGKTGKPNIDWCEQHKFETTHSNVIIPIFIQEACRRTNVNMVHIGTGCIYSGNNYFTETDEPNFIKSHYSYTKYSVEKMLDNDVLQLRIRMPIDGSQDSRNLLPKLLSYEETINEINSVTILPDLMLATEALIDAKETGVFNVVNPDPISHTDILNMYNRYSENKKHVKEISTKRLSELTNCGRSNCTLSTQKLNSRGVYMRRTFQSLEDCIKEYVNAESPAVL